MPTHTHTHMYEVRSMHDPFHLSQAKPMYVVMLNRYKYPDTYITYLPTYINGQIGNVTTYQMDVTEAYRTHSHFSLSLVISLFSGQFSIATFEPVTLLI